MRENQKRKDNLKMYVITTLDRSRCNTPHSNIHSAVSALTLLEAKVKQIWTLPCGTAPLLNKHAVVRFLVQRERSLLKFITECWLITEVKTA